MAFCQTVRKLIVAASMSPRPRPRPERPSWESSWLPRCFVPQDGIEEDDELAHASDDGELGRLSGGLEPMISARQRQITPNGDQDGHEECRPYHGSAARDGATSSQVAAVSIEGSDPDQRRGLMAIEGAQLGQLGD